MFLHILGDNFHMYTKNADYARVADVVDGPHFSRPLPELPTEVTMHIMRQYFKLSCNVCNIVYCALSCLNHLN